MAKFDALFEDAGPFEEPRRDLFVMLDPSRCWGCREYTWFTTYAWTRPAPVCSTECLELLAELARSAPCLCDEDPCPRNLRI